MEVEEGAEAVAEEGVEAGDKLVGTWTWPSHRRTMLPFLDSTSASSLERRGRDLGVGGDVEAVEQVRDLAVDVLASVVDVEGMDGEGEGGDEVFEDGDHELLGDPADGSKVLELRDFVDDVDDVGALLSVQVAEMHGVDAQEAGLAVRPWLAAHSEARGRGVGLTEGEAPGPVGTALAEVVDVAVGNPGEPLEAFVAVDVAHAPEDHLGRGSGELAKGLVDLGQQGRVVGGVAARKWLGRRLATVVTNASGPAVLGDETVHLGLGEAGRLLEEPPHQALVRLPERVVLESDECPANHGVRGGAVGELEVRRFVAFHEGPHLVEGPDPFGAKCHDHPPMISSPRTSASSPVGNPRPVQPHSSLDKTETGGEAAIW